ncbi:hypothetical protein FRC08_002595 [Ceratobasidium sp. 394]|nr:hypothetical protein FRC08_002595 [Ceratobasidium sp. 394]
MAKGGREDAKILVSQLVNYAYNMSPFNGHYDPEIGPLNWWKSMQSRESATHVALVAVKLFSISPSSIPNGRTASTLGWLGSARRSQLAPKTLVECAQLRNYYLKGVGDTTQQTHQSHIKISDRPSALNIGIFAAPALEDLLNSGENFNAATSNQFNLDNTPEIEDGEPYSFTIIRQGLSFFIEHYVDLGGEAVARRYKGCNLPITTPIESVSEVVRGTGNTMYWTPDDLFR